MFDDLLLCNLGLPLASLNRVVVFMLHCDLLVYFDLAGLQHKESVWLFSLLYDHISNSVNVDFAEVFDVLNLLGSKDCYFSKEVFVGL